MIGLFPAPRPPRQAADLSVRKFIGFLAAPQQAEMRISFASHSTTQFATLQVVRTTWPLLETVAEGPAGRGDQGDPQGRLRPAHLAPRPVRVDRRRPSGLEQDSRRGYSMRAALATKRPILH
jgi:hypothetical protein